MQFSTGGVGYHWRAWRFKDPLWQNYLDNIAQWLINWEQRNDQILLIGPSAGYSLPLPFLQRYKQVLVNDIDPLARILFRRRFNDLNIKSISENLIGDNGKKLIKLCHSRPMDILFCNILGQITAMKKPVGALIKNLPTNINYASYHDLFSFTGNYHWLCERLDLSENLSGEEIIKKFLQLSGNPLIEIEDHGISTVFSQREKTLIHWEIAPNRHHLIECVSSNSF